MICTCLLVGWFWFVVPSIDHFISTRYLESPLTYSHAVGMMVTYEERRREDSYWRSGKQFKGQGHWDIWHEIKTISFAHDIYIMPWLMIKTSSSQYESWFITFWHFFDSGQATQLWVIWRLKRIKHRLCSLLT